MVAPNHFNITPRLLLCVLALSLLQCRKEIGIDPYSVQYGLVESKEAITVHSTQLDSVQFADGLYRYFLRGTISNGKEHGNFLLCTEGIPAAMNSRMISHRFSFGKESAQDYSCKVFWAENDRVIEWREEAKLLRIVLPPTSTR